MSQELKNLQYKYAINLFDWYDFSGGNVLIIGDVYENFIYDITKKVDNVYVILETLEINKVLQYNSFANNVKIITDLIDDDIDGIKSQLNNVKFDYCIIPSITKKVASFIGNELNDIVDNVTSNYIKERGTLLMAFDNKYSFSFLAGNKKTDEVYTFTYDNIKCLRNYCRDKKNNCEVSIYFPIPEYRFPLRIYSEKYLPNVDDEAELTKNLVKLNKYEELCNSYILVVEKSISKNELSKKTLYVKYNLNRTKRFALRTSIIEQTDGKKQVIKKAVFNDANKHIADMVLNADVIDNKQIEVLKPVEYIDETKAKDGKAYVVYDFLEGEMLTDLIIRRIHNGEKEKEIITEYLYKLIGKFSGLIQNYNLDCTFSNAIVVGDKIYVIDSEWITKETTEVDFLRYRILKYFYKSAKQDLSYATFREMIRDFGITYSDIERYENAENEFQSKVHENINNLDITKYEELNPGLEKLYYVKAELDRAKDQLERITGENNSIDYQANKQNEIIRLTQVHVNNLEAIIENYKEQVNALNAQSIELFKREGIIYKIIRKVKNIVKKLLPEETARNKICKYIYRTFRHPFKMLKTYLTKQGRNRIVGDFMIGDAYFECGKVALPKCDNPKVSIIIPCYNQIRYTYKCLYSIMNNTDVNITPYEVIIADDVSTDTTKNISKYVDNVIVSRNSENLGFLKNCNNAAKLARGEYIYFLNNDTEVKPNYLYSLVTLLDNNSNIGLAGSKLIFANGKLQEAGGIIWKDGTGANYGRGDDPNNFKYNYVKEVDYISGAAIMIRKSLWNVIGGFDERYVPAYCEDSDLAFEVRKFGYKVVYEPLSEIIHYEGISNGTDVDDTNSIKSYQVTNNEKLKEKWKEELSKQFPNKDIPDFFRARERAMDKKTILFIDHYVPTWDRDAGSKTVFSYMMMFLLKGYHVKFLGDNYILNEPYGNKLQQLGIEVLFGNELQANIWEYLKENKRSFDFIFLNRPHIATKYIDFIRQNMFTKIIYYGHDLHYVRLQREYDLMGDDNALNEFKYYRNLEYSLLYKADMSYYPSYKEIEEIKRVDDTLRVKAINAYIFDEKDIVNRNFEETENILFVGGFNHDPNKDALRWLDESIMPRIKSRNKDINLIVVGSGANDEVKNICARGGYDLKGYVTEDELLDLYKKTRIVIAPLRYGAGIKGKIVEAMANGAAIVTTNCGAEGILDADKFLRIKDDASEFAQEVLKLYNDFDELKKLSVAAQEDINKRFTMEAAWNIVKDDF